MKAYARFHTVLTQEIDRILDAHARVKRDTFDESPTQIEFLTPLELVHDASKEIFADLVVCALQEDGNAI